MVKHMYETLVEKNEINEGEPSYVDHPLTKNSVFHVPANQVVMSPADLLSHANTHEDVASQ